jgi:tetratricopeptide (TPR) repeat protein
MEYYDRLRLDEHYTAAKRYVRDHQYADAMLLLEALIADTPEYAPAYHLLGWLYDKKYCNTQMANAMYKECIERDPGYTRAYYNMAVTTSALYNWQELKTLLDQATELEEIDKDWLHNEYAIMYELQGNYIDAIIRYKYALSFSEDKPDVLRYKKSIDRCKLKMNMFRAD